MIKILLVLSFFTMVFTKSATELKQEKLVHLVFPESCFQQFQQMQFNDTECLKVTFIKTLGYSIVVLGTIAKIPQIMNIMKAGSTTGLSMLSVFVESVGYMLTIGYNYHFGYSFNTYGELVFLFIQNMLILTLFFVYKPSLILNSLFYQSVLTIGLYSFINDLIPSQFYQYNIYCNIAIVVMARLPQITLNMVNKSTGTLSIITQTLFLGGSLARLLTIVSELSDLKLTILYVLSSAFNGTLVFQILMFWGSSTKKVVKSKTE